MVLVVWTCLYWPKILALQWTSMQSKITKPAGKCRESSSTTVPPEVSCLLPGRADPVPKLRTDDCVWPCLSHGGVNYWWILTVNEGQICTSCTIICTINIHQHWNRTAIAAIAPHRACSHDACAEKSARRCGQLWPERSEISLRPRSWPLECWAPNTSGRWKAPGGINSELIWPSWLMGLSRIMEQY